MGKFHKYKDRQGNVVEAETDDGLTFRVFYEDEDMPVLEYDHQIFIHEFEKIEANTSNREDG